MHSGYAEYYLSYGLSLSLLPQGDQSWAPAVKTRLKMQELAFRFRSKCRQSSETPLWLNGTAYLPSLSGIWLATAFDGFAKLGFWLHKPLQPPFSFSLCPFSFGSSPSRYLTNGNS